MDIIEKLNAIGIKPGQPADILLDSARQLRLIRDYGIDTRQDRFTGYRCLISSNPGYRKYRAPILGHSRESMIPASSLQLGIFNILYFDKVLPLNPSERQLPQQGFELALFRIPNDRYDLQDLVERYNLQKVYQNFLTLDDASKKSQAKLIDAYAAKTYPEFRKLMKIGRKAFINKLNDSLAVEGPRFEVTERTDAKSVNEFEVLMAAHREQSESK